MNGAKHDEPRNGGFAEENKPDSYGSQPVSASSLAASPVESHGWSSGLKTIGAGKRKQFKWYRVKF